MPNEREVTLSSRSESPGLQSLLFSVHLPLFLFMKWLCLHLRMVAAEGHPQLQSHTIQVQGGPLETTKTLNSHFK